MLLITKFSLLAWADVAEKLYVPTNPFCVIIIEYHQIFIRLKHLLEGLYHCSTSRLLLVCIQILTQIEPGAPFVALKFANAELNP